MKKIIIKRSTAKYFDYIFTVLYITMAFWANWKIGIAFICFDAMRAFEDWEVTK